MRSKGLPLTRNTANPFDLKRKRYSPRSSACTIVASSENGAERSSGRAFRLNRAGIRTKAKAGSAYSEVGSPCGLSHCSSGWPSKMRTCTGCSASVADTAEVARMPAPIMRSMHCIRRSHTEPCSIDHQCIASAEVVTRLPRGLAPNEPRPPRASHAFGAVRGPRWRFPGVRGLASWRQVLDSFRSSRGMV